MAMLTRNDCLTTLTLEGASFAGAMKVEEKERNKRSRKSEVTGSNALKPSTRANKQRQQNIRNKKKGGDITAKRKTRKVAMKPESLKEDHKDKNKNTTPSSSSSSSSSSSDDDDDDTKMSMDENKNHEQVLCTPRESARNSNAQGSGKLPLSELILPSWSTFENLACNKHQSTKKTFSIFCNNCSRSVYQILSAFRVCKWYDRRIFSPLLKSVA